MVCCLTLGAAAFRLGADEGGMRFCMANKIAKKNEILRCFVNLKLSPSFPCFFSGILWVSDAQNNFQEGEKDRSR